MERKIVRKFDGKTKKGNSYYGLELEATMVGNVITLGRTIWVSEKIYKATKEGMVVVINDWCQIRR